LNIAEHSLFKREDDDVILDVPVSYLDAIFGCSLEVPTLSGKIMVKIPPGTHSGQVLRIKGKGFQKSGGFGSGDMLIRLGVDTPTTITSEQKKLLEDLKNISEVTPQVKEFNEKVSLLVRSRK
jgi:molecular chaperone DnaJ